MQKVYELCFEIAQPQARSSNVTSEAYLLLIIRYIRTCPIKQRSPRYYFCSLALWVGLSPLAFFMALNRAIKKSSYNGSIPHAEWSIAALR